MISFSKKIIATCILFFCCIHSHVAQKNPETKPLNTISPTGFSPVLAKDLMALCCSFTFIDLYNTDGEIIPEGCKKIYSSGVFGMDNKYQIYKKENTAIINIRGSTDKQLSWLENMYSSMIPAVGKIIIPGDTFNYCFAKDPGTTVHSGYALAIAFLSKDILSQLKNLNNEGIFNIIIAGHSQGGALAQLLRAYLENAPAAQLSIKNKFSVYAFANPMIGNKQFADEYSKRYAGTSFSIINPADLIPRLPLKYSERKLFSQENVTAALYDRKNFSLRQTVTDAAINNYDKKISKYVKYAGSRLEKRISKDVGKVEMPDYVEGINFEAMETRIVIEPFEYPQIRKDAATLQKDSLNRIKAHKPPLAEKDKYKSEPNGYQHKAYNYYAGFIKMYFPLEYAALKKKYLQENL